MVGDPSGKRDERPILGLEQIDRNAEGIARQLARFLAFEGSNAARMRNNADWLRGIPLMEFLRDTGKHFTLGYMLQKESVRSRLERGISYTEFSYMLIQAYDFWHLHRTERCELQMGGSDQWGNITAGIELIGRREGKQVHGLVFPLLTTASGAKFGKSEGRQHLARPGADQPVPLLPVLAQHRRRGRRALPQAVHLSPARADRRGHGGARARARTPRGAAASWPARSRRRARAGRHRAGDPDQRGAVRRQGDGEVVGRGAGRDAGAAGRRARSCRRTCQWSRCWWRAGWRAPRPTRGAGFRARGST